MLHVLLTVFCLLWNLVPAQAADSMAATEGSPHAVVAGCVNVITGDHFISENDAVVQGACPLPLKRLYFSSKHQDTHGGWKNYLHVFAGLFIEDLDEEKASIRIREPNGTLLNFKYKNRFRNAEGRYVYKLSKSSLKAGLTNVGRGTISGRSNLKNIRIETEAVKGFDSFRVYTPDGAIRYYKSYGPTTKTRDMDSERIGGSPAMEFFLECERLPNQRKIHYEYNKKKFRLEKIKTSNFNDSKTYATATFDYESNRYTTNHDYDISTSDGKKLNYHFRRTGNKANWFWLNQVNTPANPGESIAYDHKMTVGKESLYLMTGRNLPLQRHYKVEYYKKGKNAVAGTVVKLKEKSPFINRVKTLKAPVGNDATSLVTHQFIYHTNPPHTKVRDIDNVLTEYYYTDQQRLEKVVYYDQNCKVHHSEHFVWGTVGSSAANLLCQSFYDHLNKPIYARRYFYDDYGEILEEKLYGNLSGTAGGFLIIGNDGLPAENGVQVYTIKRSFSQDDYHLPIREEEPNGKITVHSYLPGTSLLASEIIYDHTQIKRRHFYIYNADFIVVREIVDDGSTLDKDDYTGVKTRLIKEIELVPSGSYQDMPQILREKYWNGHEEVLLKKTILTYGDGGRVEQQDIYDATDTFRYSLTTKYDQGGHVKEETNAIGQKAIYDHDDVGNRIISKDYSGRKYAQMIYDYSNRMTFLNEFGDDGLKRTTEYRYDTKNNKIAEIDPFGQTTHFTPDPFGNIIETRLPPCPDSKGNLMPSIIAQSYDSARRNSYTREANGDETLRQYNARNQVISIVHPNKTTESFVYYLDGTLRWHVDKRGAKTEYTYDFLGRMTSKTNALGHVTTFVYDAFNLISLIDAEGNETIYEYDGAGRKVAEQLNDERAEFGYDALGRLRWTQKGDLRSISEYNNLDQITEERQEDPSGQVLSKVAYEYDVAGNRSVIKRWIEGQEAKETFAYDSFNRLTEYKDALGFVTITSYDDHWINDQGQKVLQTTELDPVGLQTITTYDVRGRVASFEKRKSSGETLTLEQNYYDVSGNLEQHIKNHRHITEWKYGPMNQLKQLIEGGSKITGFAYNKVGQLKSKTKPDGTVLKNKYDILGQLKEIFSSEGSIRYTFGYNKIGQQIGMKDEVHQRSSWKRQDALGRVLEEGLANGLVIASKYDEQGRKKLLELPDRSSIAYTYDALYLKTITRYDQTHSFNSYDLSGHLLEQELVGGLGKMLFHYDLLGRRKGYEANLGLQKLKFDPVGNVRKLRTGKERETFRYDDLNQLTAEKNHHYSYDKEGNRASKDQETYDVDSLDQVQSHQKYDLNGNPYHDQRATYSYDAMDRLIQIEGPSYTLRLFYDDQSRLLKKTVNGKEVLYLYDGLKEIGAADASGRIIELRILNPTYISERGSAVLVELSGKQYFPQHDLFGNVRGLFDLNGKKIEAYEYSAFGEGIKASINPWQYCSKRSFYEAGLINFGLRFYDPNLGRWLTPDPAGLVDGSDNLYQFVENNPLSKLDLYGLYPIPMSFLSTSLADPNQALQATAAVVHAGGDLVIETGNFFANAGFLVASPYFLYKNKGEWAGIKADWRSTQNTFASWHSQLDKAMQSSVPANDRGALYDNVRNVSEAAAYGYFVYKGVGTLVQRGLYAYMDWQASRTLCKLAPLEVGSFTPPPTFKPFTQANFRENLIRLTGINPGEQAQAHHWYTQKFNNIFISKGINIHNPHFGSWWETTSHLQNAYKYNVAWKDFLRENPSGIEMIEFGKQLMSDYNLPIIE